MQTPTFDNLRWISGAPVLTAHSHPHDADVSIKDPSVVFYNNRWHVYATSYVLNRAAPHMIYLAFERWEDADAAPRFWIDLQDEEHCAPQIFFFEPQQKWYLIYQRHDPQTRIYGPAFSTLENVARPETLSAPQAMFDAVPELLPDGKWLDFWVICDNSRAFLFFVDNRGSFYRCQTALEEFPFGWSAPIIVLSGTIYDLFEGSCTYKLKDSNQYLTLIEAVSKQDGARYYKAWIADRLDSDWTLLTPDETAPFAGPQNVEFAPEIKPWTRSISHGELLRAGFDQTMTLDPANLKLLFQGNDPDEAIILPDRQKPLYRHLPYKLGLLELL